MYYFESLVDTIFFLLCYWSTSTTTTINLSTETQHGLVDGLMVPSSLKNWQVLRGIWPSHGTMNAPIAPYFVHLIQLLFFRGMLSLPRSPFLFLPSVVVSGSAFTTSTGAAIGCGCVSYCTTSFCSSACTTTSSSTCSSASACTTGSTSAENWDKENWDKTDCSDESDSYSVSCTGSATSGADTLTGTLTNFTLFRGDFLQLPHLQNAPVLFSWLQRSLVQFQGSIVVRGALFILEILCCGMGWVCVSTCMKK